MIKAVSLDAAGTLFRVRGSVGAAYAGVAARHGVRVDAAEIERCFGAAFRRMPPLCFPGIDGAELPQRERAWWKQVVTTAFAGCRFADFAAFFDDLFEHFARPEAWELFPDVLPTLAALRARDVRLALVSNFDGRLERLCDSLGIATDFQAIVISSRVGCAKPDPRIFMMALERLRVPPGAALHVGDSEVDDVEGARAAGLQAMLIRREEADAEAAGRIRDLRELLRHV